MKTYKKSGTLSGTDTVDNIEFTVNVPAKISYTVSAKGSGSNELRVRSQTKLVLIWATVHDFKVDPGKSKTKSFEANSDTTTSTSDGKQDLRFKLSRKALTKEIEWELEWTVE